MLCFSHPNQAPICAKPLTTILLGPRHVSDTGRSFKTFRPHSVTVHTSCVPQPLNFLFCAPLVLESVNVWRTVQLSPTTHKGLCYLVSVFPSFTYLTAAVLSFVVFPFTLFSSALTPAGQWIILIVSLSDPLISMSLLIGLIVKRLFHCGWRYHARQGQTNYSTFH